MVKVIPLKGTGGHKKVQDVICIHAKLMDAKSLRGTGR